MDEEERKLTILLAKLNSDLQIQLAQTLGLLAVSLASFVASYQLLVETSLRPLNFYIFAFLLTFSLFLMYAAIRFQQKLKITMKKISELK
jgi:hypothetical protein